MGCLLHDGDDGGRPRTTTTTNARRAL